MFIFWRMPVESWLVRRFRSSKRPTTRSKWSMRARATGVGIP